MNISYPTGTLTKLARAFATPSNGADVLKAQAYMASAAANRDRDLAAAEKYRAEAGWQQQRNKAATPEGYENSIGAMFGFTPEDMAAWRASRNPAPQAASPAGGVETFPLEAPAAFVPTGNLVDVQPIGRGANEVVGGLEQVIATAAQAAPVAPQRQPVAPRDFTMQNNLLGQALMQLGLSGNTNAEQLQDAARKALEARAIHGVSYGDGGQSPGDIALMQRLIQMGASPDKAIGAAQEAVALADALQGRDVAPQAMALMKASPVYNTQGVNNYTGAGGDAFNIGQTNEMQRERIRSGDRRYNTDVDARTSRANNADSNAAAMARHTTPGANKDKSAADETEAINAIDLTLPIVPQVPRSDPNYVQFYRIYTNAKKAGDLRTMRGLVHKALKHGIIQQGE